MSYIAYIGPGAGFAFMGSFLFMFLAFGLVLLTLLNWPFRAFLSLLLRSRHKRKTTSIRRVVVVGLDGLDPERCRTLMKSGKLPNLAALAENGLFSDLESTTPPISPVAWSSFATGVNPGKHNIFDFMNRDLKTMLPELSSSRIRTYNKKAKIEPLQKSKPFWHILGDYGVFSTIQRVPITFPAKPFRGLLLSGMCVPDLRGTQGSFTFYSDAPPAKNIVSGGNLVQIHFKGNTATTLLSGPPGNDDQIITTPLKIIITKQNKVIIKICGQKISLKHNQYSDWIRLIFYIGSIRKVYGICKFLLLSTESDFKLYVTPVNIDPEHPALTISHPFFYSAYLAKLHGSFATLGLAEDTWALNEGIISDAAFLEQVYSIHAEREKMFFDALNRTRKGLCICVFDAPDRIQHTFMRENQISKSNSTHDSTVINSMYEKMDALIGRVSAKIKDNDILLVVSDHGFTNFKRGVNLNAWLREEGLLSTNNSKNNKWLQGINWSHTKAYTFGLSGIYINRKGRERAGIVENVTDLKQEIINKLQDLRDPLTGKRVIVKIHDTEKEYNGPYRDNGPDLVVGYQKGYRASWGAASGKVEESIFSDNNKPWSGDHCVDASCVPGVFFCNKKPESERNMKLVDLAPTILNMFGIPVPEYMDGEGMVIK